ncbi:MAG: PVC-type heme-binding CxxCH protein, partial [Candidatus Hydrogenedentota bacterium]
PDRLQHDGWLESSLHAAHPDKDLVIRNMGFTGDQVSYRPRNQNFMTADDYLAHMKTDVIFAFFGYNESFAQDPEAFKEQLNTFIDETRAKQYNGVSAPRIVLISPIAYENLDTPNLPDGEELNKWLSTYTDAMASVARRKKVPFVDLYYPSEELYEETDAPLTINGVHLNSTGTQAISKLIADELLGDVDTKNIDAIRASVKEKNWCWFNRYRATDGNDVWGSRAELSFVNDQTNEVVLQHELNMLDIMCESRDRVTWNAANGRTVRIDDSNVPDPIQVITNIDPKADRLAADGGHKFVPPEEGPDTLNMDDGLEVNLFASEEMFPELINPVQLDVDTKGRLWAALWSTYPKWQPDLEMSDRLVIFEDTDNDGVADNMKTFAHVHNPTGFTFWNGGVLVASAPEILFLKDTDGDDVADVREVMLSGIDSSDTHHSANGFDYGPDGYLYYQRGIFNVSNVETPWQTAQLNGQSAIYRWNPRTHRFSYHAENPPNPHGGDFDYWGYHYATSATGGEAYQIRQTTRGKFRMYKLLDKTVRPVPSSGILSSQHFPKKYEGNFIILNSIGFLGIKRYTLENTDGVIWGTETDNLLVSTDSNFRPTDFKVGNDGALYVSDWANPIIGHMQHNIRDPNRDHRHGRIYRVTAKGRPLQDPVKIDGESIPALLDVLKHPTNGVRLRARIELSERNTDEVIAATNEWIKQFDFDKKKDAHHLTEALWIHQQHNVVDEAFLNEMLESPEPNARRAAIRVKYMWTLEDKFKKKPN